MAVFCLSQYVETACIKVNKAMAFYVKELLLTGMLTKCDWPYLINQIQVNGRGMDINLAKAPCDQDVFAK